MNDFVRENHTRYISVGKIPCLRSFQGKSKEKVAYFKKKIYVSDLFGRTNASNHIKHTDKMYQFNNYISPVVPFSH